MATMVNKEALLPSNKMTTGSRSANSSSGSSSRSKAGSNVGTATTATTTFLLKKPRFPSGCSVRLYRYDNQQLSTCHIPSQQVDATVVKVEVQGGKRVYTVQVPNDDDTTTASMMMMAVPEHQLQFSLWTPVWILSCAGSDKYERGLIIGSDHCPSYLNNRRNKDYFGCHTLPNLVYSVQTISGKMHQGVLPDNLVYRSSENAPEMEQRKEAPSAFAETIAIEKTMDTSDASAFMTDQKDASCNVPVASVTTMTDTSSREDSIDDQTVSSFSSGVISQGSKLTSSHPTKKVPARASSLANNLSHQTNGHHPKNVHRPAGPVRSFSYDQSYKTNPMIGSFGAQQQRPPFLPSSKNNEVINPFPNPFQFIAVGEQHLTIPALRQLKEWNKAQGLGCYATNGVIWPRCLNWHLTGRCNAQTCRRAQDHVRLAPRQAKALEEALMPVIGPQGPIFGRQPSSPKDKHNQHVPPFSLQQPKQEQHGPAPPQKRTLQDRYTGPTLLKVKREELLGNSTATSKPHDVGRYKVGDAAGDWSRQNNRHPKRDGMGFCFGASNHNNREWKKQRRY